MLLNNIRWVGLAQASRIGAQLIGLAVLARLLNPSDYGLMAMVGVVIAFAMLLRDMGTAAAVVQQRELEDETVDAVFWFNTLIGLGLFAITATLAPLIAMAFRVPELSGLLVVAALAFPVSAMTVVHQALLERRSQFRTVARVEITATVAALAIAVLLAYQGFGVYSLVIQAVAAAVFTSVQYAWAARWLPSSGLRWARLRPLIGFTSNLLGFNFVNYFARNADSMVIGRFLGPTALGTYSIAYKLMLFPLQNLTFVVTRAMYPILCRHQDDVPAMRDLYLRSLRGVAILTAPLMAGAVVLREPLIQKMFGPQWSQSAEVLAWLAPTGFVQSIVSTTGSVLMARGRTDVLFKLGAFSAAIQLLAFAIGLPFGVVGVAFCYFIANLLTSVPCMVVVCITLGSPVTSVLKSVSPAAFSAVLTAGLLAMGEKALPSHFLLSFQGIAGFVLVGGICYVATLKLAFGQSLMDIRRLLGANQ